MSDKLIVIYYDEEKTTLEELGQLSEWFDKRYELGPVLFLPDKMVLKVEKY